jgi:hypothetical protein
MENILNSFLQVLKIFAEPGRRKNGGALYFRSQNSWKVSADVNGGFMCSLCIVLYH